MNYNTEVRSDDQLEEMPSKQEMRLQAERAAQHEKSVQKLARGRRSERLRKKSQQDALSDCEADGQLSSIPSSVRTNAINPQKLPIASPTASNDATRETRQLYKETHESTADDTGRI